MSAHIALRLNPGAEQERRRLDGIACAYDRPRCNLHLVDPAICRLHLCADACCVVASVSRRRSCINTNLSMPPLFGLVIRQVQGLMIILNVFTSMLCVETRARFQGWVEKDF